MLTIIEYFLLCFTIAVVCYMIIGGILEYFREKKWWNNGICSLNNEKWIYFDQDSQGGRGYTTFSGKHVCWISYPNIDKNYN